MSNLFWIGLMLIGGVAIAVQPSINGRLAQKVGSLESSMISFAVGTLALLVVVLLMGRGSMRSLSGAAWWELTGGLLGAFFVTLTILTVPRLGTTAVMATVIAGQLITGALIDHYNLFGMRHLPLTSSRLAGIALLAAGALLIIKR